MFRVQMVLGGPLVGVALGRVLLGSSGGWSIVDVVFGCLGLAAGVYVARNYKLD